MGGCQSQVSVAKLSQSVNKCVVHTSQVYFWITGICDYLPIFHHGTRYAYYQSMEYLTTISMISQPLNKHQKYDAVDYSNFQKTARRQWIYQSKKNTYVIKLNSRRYSCTCPSFRDNRNEFCHCKHIRACAVKILTRDD